jgi:hypothetical protein
MPKAFTSGESEHRTPVLSVLKRDDMRRDFSLTCVIIIGEEAEKVNIDLIIQKTAKNCTETITDNKNTVEFWRMCPMKS